MQIVVIASNKGMFSQIANLCFLALFYFPLAVWLFFFALTCLKSTVKVELANLVGLKGKPLQHI